MSRYSDRLSVDEIERATPGEKPIRCFDGRGLYMEISPSGGKLWRMRYRFAGKEKLLSFGAYPAVSMSDARKRREAARKLLAQGIDPSVARRQQKARATADRLAQEDASKVHVAVALDGGMEIWKGQAVLSLMRDEAQAVKNLLTKLIA
jgi:Arm domain-containing DNA-binding protein